MALDTQYTGRFKEKGPKAWELRDNVIMGIAGVNNYNYLFYRRLADEFDKTDEITLPDRIDRGIEAFNTEIFRRNKATLLTRSEIDYNQPEAIIAGYDEGLESFAIFQVSPPDPCDQIAHRAAVGTGGTAATVFLKTIESLMEDYRIRYTDLSWQLIGQLSFILLSRVSFLDPNSSGATILYLEKDSNAIVDPSALFPKGTSPNFLSAFTERVIEEVGIEKVDRFLKDWKLKDLLKGLGGSP